MVERPVFYDDLAGVVCDAGLFLEDVHVKKAGKHTKLEVVVDREVGPEGVGMDELEAVTKAVSAWCDATDPVNGAYTLEVTTPGIERPLTQWRHFSRAQGHTVDIKLKDGTVFSGVKLCGVEDDRIIVGDGPNGATIELKDIETARMVVSL